MNRHTVTTLSLTTLAFVATSWPARPVGASSFHTYCVEELFSTADGKVQFIELLEMEGLDGQGQFDGAFLRADESLLRFQGNLPGDATANTTVLIATADFAKQCPGVPPDYIIPSGFVDVLGDTISLLEEIDGIPTSQLSFVKGQLPTDGNFSLLSNGTTAPSTPTNYWGQSCSLNVVIGAVPAASTWTLTIMAGALLGVGGAVIKRGRKAGTC